MPGVRATEIGVDYTARVANEPRSTWRAQAYNAATQEGVLMARTWGPRVIVAGALACHALTAPSAILSAGQTSGAGPGVWAGDLSPLPLSEWSYDRAAHLLERAGFGATPEEIERFAAMTPQRAVDTLIDYDTIDDRGQPPVEESGIWDAGMDPFPPSRAEAVRIAREHGEGLGEKFLP